MARFRNQYGQHQWPAFNESGFQASVTVPNQAMTVQEILNLRNVGINDPEKLKMQERIPLFESEGQLSWDEFKALDIAERYDRIKTAARELNKLKAQKQREENERLEAERHEKWRKAYEAAQKTTPTPVTVVNPPTS